MDYCAKIGWKAAVHRFGDPAEILSGDDRTKVATNSLAHFGGEVGISIRTIIDNDGVGL